MRQHLTPDEFAGLLAGITNDPASEEHIRQCGLCGGQYARVQQAIGSFRQSIVEIGEREAPGPSGAMALMNRPARRAFRLGRLAALAAGVTLALPIYGIISRHNRPDREQSAEQRLQDEMLLNAVEARLSRRVPSAFTPMMELMSLDWDQEMNSPSKEKE